MSEQIQYNCLGRGRYRIVHKDGAESTFERTQPVDDLELYRGVLIDSEGRRKDVVLDRALSVIR